MIDVGRRGRRAQVAAVAVGLAVAGLATGCGSSSNGEASKPAAQIYRDAVSATSAASSVLVDGSSSGAQALTFHLVAGHNRGGGTLEVRGSTLHLVLAAGRVYVKGSAQAWDALAGTSAAGPILADKWWYAPAGSGPLASLAKVLTTSGIVSEVKPTGTFHKGKVTTVDGIRVVPLIDSSGAMLDVAATGTPHIVAISQTTGTVGRATFTHYGSATPPATPHGARPLPIG